MKVLEVNNVFKQYSKNIALRNVSFTISEKEIVGFVGPNGAGKSTLMKIMVGLIPPTSGSVKVMGFDIKKQREQALKKIGCTIESPYFYEYLTGKENLRIIANMYENISEEDILYASKRVGIDSNLHRKVREYSLGMKQRLALAQAIIMKPSFLILDEPTNGLDPKGIAEFREILKQINEEGCTIFISSHILSEIENICEKVLFIDKGEILTEKSLEDNIDHIENYIIICSNAQEFLKLLKNKNYIKRCDIDDNKILIEIEKKRIKDVIKLSVLNNIDIFYISEFKRNLEDEFFELLER
ncbi:ABC transporter ATP-binding protein [Clostridium sp. MB40-C1]|uniref:ABC transporter ATP-binding protein n=1 Tax=Clostridium sp. MB40-C1 TaxID=3070996 RepID=UPI0027DF5714|nr:ABC transporter ATP-binding protein [Clostridium sp. MB40-C1]WMJ80059.1 ABC transporter ATP-binding protein [Clostridium sp. MB40-C1]